MANSDYSENYLKFHEMLLISAGRRQGRFFWSRADFLKNRPYIFLGRTSSSFPRGMPRSLFLQTCGTEPRGPALPFQQVLGKMARHSFSSDLFKFAPRNATVTFSSNLWHRTYRCSQNKWDCMKKQHFTEKRKRFFFIGERWRWYAAKYIVSENGTLGQLGWPSRSA